MARADDKQHYPLPQYCDMMQLKSNVPIPIHDLPQVARKKQLYLKHSKMPSDL